MTTAQLAAVSANSQPHSKLDGFGRTSPNVARALLVLAVCAAAVAGFMVTGAQARGHAMAATGVELANLLRAMAAIKAAMAAVVALAVFWRLGSPATPPWLAGYLGACAAMSVGIGLIWDLAHIVPGAFLLHAGLIAAIVLFWRDREVRMRIAALVAARRAALPELRAE